MVVGELWKCSNGGRFNKRKLCQGGGERLIKEMWEGKSRKEGRFRVEGINYGEKQVDR